MRPVYRVLAIGALVLAGCTGKPPEAPKREDYNSKLAVLKLSLENVIVSDEIGDGEVDTIKTFNGYYLWTTPELKKRYNAFNVLDITPEMRETATRALKLKNELDYQIAKSQYEEHFARSKK